MIDIKIATDVDELNQMQRQSMAEYSHMLSINGQFVNFSFSKDQYLKCFIGSDVRPIAIFLSPLSILEMISYDRWFTRPDAQMENNVLVGVQSWSVDKVHYASEKKFI